MLFFAVAVFAGNCFAQTFFKENQEVHSNLMPFSDTITSKDTIIFINSINSGNFPSLRKVDDFSSKKNYYTWSLYDSGASITHVFKVDGKWQGSNSYYTFQVRQEEIFGKAVLIFNYENKLYFFEIIVNRPAPFNGGSLIALVKL